MEFDISGLVITVTRATYESGTPAPREQGPLPTHILFLTIPNALDSGGAVLPVVQDIASALTDVGEGTMDNCEEVGEDGVVQVRILDGLEVPVVFTLLAAGFTVVQRG